MKKFIYLLLFILASLVLIWLFAPIQHVYPWFAERLQPLQARQLEGSLYKGRAGKLNWAGIDWGQLQWNAQWPTLSGGIQGQYRLHNPQLDLSAKLQADRKAGLRASRLSGTLDWRYLESFLQLSPGHLQARPEIQLDSLHYGPLGMERVEGRVSLKGLRLITPLALPLGDLWVDIQTERQGLAVGSIHSDSRVLDASGVVYLHPHRFEVNLILKPKPGEYEAQLALQNIGQPTAGGGRRIHVAGFY